MIYGYRKLKRKVAFVEGKVSGSDGYVVGPGRCYLGVGGIAVGGVAVTKVTVRVCRRIGGVGHVFKMSIVPWGCAVVNRVKCHIGFRVPVPG